MINKLIRIKGIGRFYDYKSGASIWNGCFDPVTAIYADNGSGKTTLSQIFHSIKSKDLAYMIQRRKSFDFQEDPIVELKIDNQYSIYSNDKWSMNVSSIQVFDVYYVQDNVYSISYNRDYITAENSLIIGEEQIKLFKRRSELKQKLTSNGGVIGNISRQLKNYLLERNDEKIEEYNNKLRTSRAQHFLIKKKLKECELEMKQQSSSHETIYIEEINKILSRICPGIRISGMEPRPGQFLYHIQYCGNDLRSDQAYFPLKHTLCEGEKSTLAFAFFIANLYILPNLSEQTVVFDDPIDSLDSFRRSATKEVLVELSGKVKQLIVLSHDINFVKSFADSTPNCLVLRIKKSGHKSYIDKYDIEQDTLTGIFKDISAVKDYADNQDASKHSDRDIAARIRLILEGLMRIKYFGHIQRNEWLGDIIEKIRNSQDGELYSYHKPFLKDLNALNNYSKRYHHSNPQYLEEEINSTELRFYCQRLLELIIKL